MAEAKTLGLLTFQQAIRGGVRPNLFQIQHTWPSTNLVEPKLDGMNDDPVMYMCKSAALPATNVGTVELPFRGRVVKVPGDRTYETWTATFYNDDAFKLRAAYEKWIALTNGVDANVAEVDISDVFQNIIVSQLDKFAGGANQLETIRSYELVGAWPVSVGQIAVAYDNNDSYEEFDVEFAYQYHITKDGDSNNLVGVSTAGG
tara:strand:+ start:3925 stop:4533 length:609 start_codon:yes stop_codon:yes gene_type:complete